ncbi:hypothetical protein BDZ45DRAFT_752738 [Acephala macrosclerotiorum]|nr:hypothetical protein BDZ45DRAFT_752738 [Acephala macrosclerotiorum]
MASQNPTAALGDLSAIPLEIRNEIYRLLLLSPLLNDTSIPGKPYKEKNTPYSLHTSILYVSSIIHNEASRILSLAQRLPTPNLAPVFNKVKKWKVLVHTLTTTECRTMRLPNMNLFQASNSKFLNNAAARNFSAFTKILSQRPPNSIEVLMIPRHITAEYRDGWNTYLPVDEMLNPLLLLKSLPKGGLQFRDATLDDMPDWSVIRYTSPGFTARMNRHKRERVYTWESEMPSFWSQGDFKWVAESGLVAPHMMRPM